MNGVRSLQATLKVASFTTRKETYKDLEYLVVPIVALVQTVVHSSTSANPELVTTEEFSKAPIGWNGRPVFSGHPRVEGEYVSGNTPALLETQIGIVFNSRVEDEKLKMEAWLDIEACEAIEPNLLTRIAEGEEDIEISVGVLAASKNESGSYGGKKYKGIWTEIVPDHLAILPEDETGACSVEAGCGVRAASAFQKEEELVTEKNGGVARMLRTLIDRTLEPFRANQSAEDMSANDVRQKLGDALRALDPRVYYADDYYPDKGEVIYSVYTGDGTYKCYTRKYALSDDGKVTISGDPVEVAPRVIYEPVNGTDTAAVTAATTSTVPAAPCGCQKTDAATTINTLKENGKMNKEDVIAKLGTATDEQLANVAKVFEPAAAAVAPAAVVTETPVVAAAAAAAAKPELSAEDREILEFGRKTLQARKALSIKALKDSGRCTISDEKLATKSQSELDELVALVGTKVETVDYGANAPRLASLTEADQPVAAPPDMGAAIKANRAK